MMYFSCSLLFGFLLSFSTVAANGVDITTSCGIEDGDVTLTQGAPVGPVAENLSPIAGFNVLDNTDMVALLDQAAQTGATLYYHTCTVTTSGPDMKGFALCTAPQDGCVSGAVYSEKPCTSASYCNNLDSLLTSYVFKFTVDCKNINDDFPDCAFTCGDVVLGGGLGACFYDDSSEPTPSPSGETSAGTMVAGHPAAVQSVIAGMALALFALTTV